MGHDGGISDAVCPDVGGDAMAIAFLLLLLLILILDSLAGGEGSGSVGGSADDDGDAAVALVRPIVRSLEASSMAMADAFFCSIL